ncbi:MAG: chemotaxis protein CheW [Pseudomonadales bacterium]|nr:chemotaxis protein CheW [Pseudomonadales bacterium]
MSVSNNMLNDSDISTGEGDLTFKENDQTEQYLTFIMADEEYGVDILRVQEIRGWESVTPIPNSPMHVKGVINLRGTIVPIIDLRQRFGLENIDYGPLTVVTVLKVESTQGERIMGIVVDAVSDVYALSNQDMRDAPDLGDHIDTAYIKGLVNVDNKMVILLEINELLGSDAIPEINMPALKELTSEAH